MAGLTSPGYANVVATIALFVALGGSSYAAIRISGRNVVDGSLTSRDVKDRSLLKKVYRLGVCRGGAPGARGAGGAPGATGATGPPGAPGVSGYERVTSEPFEIPTGTERPGSASCPAGKKVLGGGAEVAGAEQTVIDSYPVSADDWFVHVTNTGAAATFTVYAICATAP